MGGKDRIGSGLAGQNRAFEPAGGVRGNVATGEMEPALLCPFRAGKKRALPKTM